MSVHHLCTLPVEVKRGSWDFLELKVQTVVSCHMEIEPGSSARAANALNHRTITPAPTKRLILQLVTFLAVLLPDILVTCG